MKKNIFSFICLAAITILVIVVIGCGSSKVDIVKNGTMEAYKSTTIAKAFEGSFDEPKWENFETKKGKRVVQFTGKISHDLYKLAILDLGIDLNNIESWIQYFPYAYAAIINNIGEEKTNKLGDEKEIMVEYLKNYFWKTGTSVQVQWTFSADGKSFELTHMGSSTWEGLEFTQILKIIYS